MFVKGGIKVSSRYQSIGVLIAVWLAFLFSYVDRLAWPPIMPLVMHDLGFSATQAGSYMTAFYIGYVITQLPGGILTDRFGYRKVLLGSFFIMGFFTAAMGMTKTYEYGFFFRVLAGIGSGAIYSASVRAIFDWFPPKGRATAMGFFMTAISFGLSSVNLFVPTVARDYGWPVAFFVAGSLPLFGLAVAYVLLKEHPTFKERQRQTRVKDQFWRDVKSLGRNRNFILTSLAGFGAMWATWGTATWANTYMNKVLHLSLVEAGFIMSLYGLAGIFCKPLVGIISDLLGGRRKAIQVVVLFLFGPTLLWFGSNENTQILIVLGPLLGIVAHVYSPVMMTFLSELVQPRMVGTASGLANTVWQLGALISPLAVGMVIDISHNYFNAFLVLAMGPTIAAILTLFVKEDERYHGEV